MIHKGCINQCGSILTGEEMDPAKNPSQTCAWCKAHNRDSDKTKQLNKEVTNELG